MNDGPEKDKGQIPNCIKGRRGDGASRRPSGSASFSNNIYGVDIDPQAVEVTKLSLLLKVLEARSADPEQPASACSMSAHCRPWPQYQVRQFADRAGLLRGQQMDLPR